MKSLLMLPLMLIILTIGGITFLSLSDVNVEQTTITKDIPLENIQ